MRSFGNLIVRLVAIMVGLGLAFLAAGLFVGIGYYNDVLAPMGPDTDHAVRGLASLVVGAFWSPFLASAAFLPAAAIILFCEWRRLRSLTINVLLGGVAALASFWLHTDFATTATPSNGALVVVLAMGFIGGFFYWLIAGRNAGRWLDAPAR